MTEGDEVLEVSADGTAVIFVEEEDGLVEDGTEDAKDEEEITKELCNEEQTTTAAANDKEWVVGGKMAESFTSI